MDDRPDVPDPSGRVGLAQEDPEELLPRGAAPWWLRRTGGQRRLAGSALVLAVGAAATAALLAQPDGRRPPPAAPPSAVALHPAGLRLDPNLPTECAHAIVCMSAKNVPTGTSAAIAQFLPGARQRLAFTVTQSGTNRLLYRAVNATSGSVELLVIVRRSAVARAPVAESLDPSPGAAIRYARRQLGRYEVEVQYTGPPGHTPPVAVAVRLAEDPRLVEPG